MSKHFSLMEFLRKVPHDLLENYCLRDGILGSFVWGQGTKEDVAIRLLQALDAEGHEASDRATIHFRTIWDMSGRGFTYGALNEAEQSKDTEAYRAIKQLGSHLSKAFWTSLERPKFVKNARMLSDVDKLPEGAWVKRGGMPVRPDRVDEAAVNMLEIGVIEYFTRTEHRGGNCKIDLVRRGGEEILFVYAEDHPDTELLWQYGQLEPQAIKPAFQLIFKYHSERQALDVFFQGDRRRVPDLQQLFARVILGKDVEPATPIGGLLYDLDRVLLPGFNFEYSPDLGISDVRAVKMRFVLPNEPWQRVLIEADNTKVRDALSTLASNVLGRPLYGRAALDQLHIKVQFKKREEDSRAPVRDCIITKPNMLRIKKDDLGEKIEKMLVQSGIERNLVEGDV